MAHLPDGILSAPVLLGGAAGSAALTAVALRRLDDAQIPTAGLLAAALFVSSLLSFPVGPSSAHLQLTGLAGVLLGWAVVPAILVALLLQAMLFGYGGLLVLGVNTLNLALPALLVGLMLGPALRRHPARAGLYGALGGGLAVAGTGALVALALALSSPDFVAAARLLPFSYLPLLALEALVTAVVLSFLMRVAPELLRHA